MEETNKLILNKKEIEEAINETIAVIYRLQQETGYADNIRTAIHQDEFGNYVIYKFNKYLIITNKHFWTIEDGKLQLTKAFE